MKPNISWIVVGTSLLSCAMFDLVNRDHSCPVVHVVAIIVGLGVLIWQARKDI